ncbi:hypothetical protein GO755_38995 [Spirosoma sp. HMF4905]|uniref:Uncharacterized protein n=1 Tax=Spirosoma arboris TaxID=2682092 RepID=A0A7K1SR42_9BACT|nr:hypothetical protein [Spirosoma arboris]MVM36066.1 hypothetical protein [Spirosoma arboris]
MERSISPSLGVRALTELQLSDWQFMLDQLNEQTGDQDAINYATRQIARLKIELAADSPAGTGLDTHVRSATHGDEPAFVVVGEFDGLSKREYFAGQALIGILSLGGVYDDSPTALAMDAVANADALIAALNQSGT